MAPPSGLLRGQNGSVRCNGRAVQCQALQTTADSGSSCSSKGDSSSENKGRSDKWFGQRVETATCGHRMQGYGQRE